MIDKIIKMLEREKLIAFETLANTGDEKFDFAYLKVGNYADKAIGIVKQVAAEENKQQEECKLCRNYGLTIDSKYNDVWGYLHEDGHFNIETGHNDSDTMQFNYCPICGRRLQPYKEG